MFRRGWYTYLFPEGETFISFVDNYLVHLDHLDELDNEEEHTIH